MKAMDVKVGDRIRLFEGGKWYTVRKIEKFHLKTESGRSKDPVLVRFLTANRVWLPKLNGAREVELSKVQQRNRGLFNRDIPDTTV